MDDGTGKVEKVCRYQGVNNVGKEILKRVDKTGGGDAYLK